jgi:hypothetical protein
MRDIDSSMSSSQMSRAGASVPVLAAIAAPDT